MQASDVGGGGALLVTMAGVFGGVGHFLRGKIEEPLCVRIGVPKSLFPMKGFVGVRGDAETFLRPGAFPVGMKALVAAEGFLCTSTAAGGLETMASSKGLPWGLHDVSRKVGAPELVSNRGMFSRTTAFHALPSTVLC